eukprot:CAMPEP_0172893054 /NCGR_PEP_ID=MMETSP1075-20121228/147635_1 /TAXON_ID=2916 /ORGANISM="Ceratium fusus, Strain PA161109" /LENGTH=107 /DNA_ID=CAMNT_0013747849 /DNA_START=3 /DNA_END=326 /DNA_ORIENTATION=+
MLFRKVAIALTVFLACAWAQTPGEEVEPDSGALLQESEQPQNEGEQSEHAEALLEEESQLTAYCSEDDEALAAEEGAEDDDEDDEALLEEEEGSIEVEDLDENDQSM